MGNFFQRTTRDPCGHVKGAVLNWSCRTFIFKSHAESGKSPFLLQTNEVNRHRLPNPSITRRDSDGISQIDIRNFNHRQTNDRAVYPLHRQELRSVRRAGSLFDVQPRDIATGWVDVAHRWAWKFDELNQGSSTVSVTQKKNQRQTHTSIP